MHKIVGNVNKERLFSVGAGAALSIEIPFLNRRSAVNVACSGVSSWQTKICDKSNVWHLLFRKNSIVVIDKNTIPLRHLGHLVLFLHQPVQSNRWRLVL